MLTEPNQLMIAAECGDLNTVNLCLKSGCNVNEKVNGKTAANLAWNNQHFEIVLDLLNANSQFPRDFKVEMATDGIKEFIGVTNNLHELILIGKTVVIDQLLKNYPNLRHFYSIKNVSAPAFALISNKFKVYEFLVANNVYIGPNENVDEIYKELSESRCKDLKKIHLKYLKSFKDSHLIVLALNSQIVNEPGDTVNKFELIRNAYKFLDQVDPLMSLILQIVAASRDFKVIFDFDSSVPEVKVNMEHGKVREIRIPAQGLLDLVQEIGVYESMAREFCIYAMELVYKNYGRPYTSTDDQTRKIFNKISTICEASRGKEELIDFLYSNKADMYHAKVMALVPQLMIKYANDPVRMEESRVNFSELFKFCQEVVEPELQHKLPTIKSSTEQTAQNIQISNKRQLKLLVALILAIPFSIWLSLFLTKPYIEPIYSCMNLTDELRSKIFESTVEFQGVNVIFGDLFGRNSTACKHLSPQEVTGMLKVFDSGKFVENYTGFYQNFTAEENELIQQEPRNAMHSLSFGLIKEVNAEQIQQENKHQDKDENIYGKYMKTIFLVPSLKVDKALDLLTKFYVPRWILCAIIRSDTFEYSTTAYPMGFNSISTSKLFFLSDKGGSGKSTYFRHMAWKLKRRFPLKWISYVDLKQHIHVLQDVPKTDANLTTVVDFLSSKLLNLTSKLEIGVFEKKFLSNESVFLWDGIDEVSPTYYNETLRLVEAVRNLTGNRQWMSTRPHLNKKIKAKFNIRNQILEQFSDEDRRKYIEKYFESKGIQGQNLSKAVTEINEFFARLAKDTFQNTNYFGYNQNPQMLFIACEAYAKDMRLDDQTNIYKVFDTFFTKKFEEVVMDKGVIVRQDFFKVTELGTFREFHQHFAVAQEIRSDIESIFYSVPIEMFNSSDILNPLAKVSDVEMMRFGIVYKNDESIRYEQQIFQDFFTAQYLYTNVWQNQLDTSPRDKDADYRLNFLFYVLHKCQTWFRLVCDFIAGFVEVHSGTQGNEPFNSIIKDMLLTKYPYLMDFMGDSGHVIDTTTRFFKKDRDVISLYWKINQNRTFFHEFFDRITSFEDVAVMTKIVKQNFNAVDAEKIFVGRHQTANFLRTAWQKRFHKNHTIAFTRAVNFKCDVDTLVKIKSFGMFMEFLEAQNYSRDELLEFFKISMFQKAIRNDNDKKVFVQYAQKLLSAQDFIDVRGSWGPGWATFDRFSIYN